MPTHTPSPHRFLAANPPSAQKSRPKSQSSLRNGFTIQPLKVAAPTREEPEMLFKKLTPAKRFVIAPHRRTQSAEEHAKGRDDVDEAWRHKQTQLTPRLKPPRNFERIESIQEPQSSPATLELDNYGRGITQSVEHDLLLAEDNAQQEEKDDDDEILFVIAERNKRRRVSPPSSSSYDHHSEPTTPIAPHNATTHRFLVPPPKTPAPFSAISNQTHNSTIASTSISTITPAPHRPAFLLPPQPISPPKPSKPLPEIFSPSRKTQKYVANGLASTMQSWIIETANRAFAPHERSAGVVWGRDREDGVRLKLRISAVSTSSSQSNDISVEQPEVECFSGHFVFVRGDTEPGLYNVSRASSVISEGGGMRVLLAGQGGARGAGGVKVRVGGIVGIRAPTWDVDVGGQKWTVGVDWVVL